MTNQCHGEIDAIADRFTAAVQAGDAAAIKAMYAADAVIWHNTDRIEQTADQNLAVLTWFVANTATRTYTDVQRTISEDGFAQQHVVVLGFADGRTAEMAACLFVKIRVGLIVRLDEYLDSAAVAGAFTDER